MTETGLELGLLHSLAGASGLCSADEDEKKSDF